MADKKLTDRSEAMEHDLNRLGDHITDAEKLLADRRKDAAPLGEDVVGDWEGKQDSAGGEDPVGAKEAGRGTPDEARERGRDDGGRQENGRDDDDRVDEEVANPT